MDIHRISISYYQMSDSLNWGQDKVISFFTANDLSFRKLSQHCMAELKRTLSIDTSLVGPLSVPERTWQRGTHIGKAFDVQHLNTFSSFILECYSNYDFLEPE